MSGQTWTQGLLGQEVGGYRLVDAIDEGNFGLVFEVESVTTSTRYAMKILKPTGDAGAAADFEREGVLLSKLVRCSSVITLVETGQDTLLAQIGGPGGPMVPLTVRFHVLTLASAVLSELTFDPDRLARLHWNDRLGLWRGAVKGVHQMHLKHVAHRDLKSNNCLVVVSGQVSDLRVADLGRAKDLTQVSTVPPEEYFRGRGDGRFAPPEHLWFQGTSDVAGFREADLYGLGSLLAELSTGHPMTALAMGSWQEAMHQGAADLRAGVRRDLAVLRPQFRRAVDEVAEAFPPTIRENATRLLAQLCDPVPSQRQQRSALGHQRRTQPGLDWLLVRADVLRRQLSSDASRRIRYRKAGNAG